MAPKYIPEAENYLMKALQRSSISSVNVLRNDVIQKPYDAIQKPYDAIQKHYDAIQKPYDAIQEPTYGSNYFQGIKHPYYHAPDGNKEATMHNKKEIKEQLLLNLNLMSQITDQKGSQSLQKELQKISPSTLEKIIDKVLI